MRIRPTRMPASALDSLLLATERVASPSRVRMNST